MTFNFSYLPFFHWIQNAMSLSLDLQYRLCTSLGIILTLWGLKTLVLMVMNGAFRNHVRRGYHAQKWTTYLSVLLGFILVGRLWFDGLHEILTFLGLLSAGVAIALRDPLANLAGWGFIMFKQPFSIGDRIELGPHQGDVVDLGLFNISLMEVGGSPNAGLSTGQPTGRLVEIPNGKIFSDPVTNFYKGLDYVWMDVPIVVSLKSDWQKAKKLLQGIASQTGVQLNSAATAQLMESSRQKLLYTRSFTPSVYTQVRGYGIQLTIRCLARPRSRRSTEEKIWESVLTQFSPCDDIELVYYDTTHLR